MKTVLWIGLLLLSLAGTASGAWAQGAPSIEQLNAEAAQARQRVIDIVNQPVVALPRTAQATEYSPGWFDPGAIKPDFDKVDVRASQELIYAGHTYVTSDVTPSQMFRGDDLEFNAMTKYFYLDRSLPKKRLTEAEMVEINSLYRVIGRAEHAPMQRWLGMALPVAAFCLAFAALVPALLFLTRRWAPPA